MACELTFAKRDSGSPFFPLFLSLSPPLSLAVSESGGSEASLSSSFLVLPFFSFPWSEPLGGSGQFSGGKA